MLSILIFLVIIFLPCMAYGIYDNRTTIYKLYPISLLSLIASLFIEGVIFGLGIAFWITIISILLFSLIFFMGGIQRKREIRCILISQIKQIVPILVIFAVFAYCDRGMLAGHTSDDFTHWIYVVKEMVHLDDFGTNPAANCMFASYPPGIALLQYFLIKAHEIFANGSFSEWRAFYAYHILLATFFFPFLKRDDGIFRATFKLAILCILPVCFFQAYSGLQPESLLGVAFGTGIAYVLIYQEKDKVCFFHILLLCFFLVLIKDAGMMFAVFLGLIYMIDLLKKGNNKKDTLSSCGIIVASIVSPKLLWNYEIARNQATIAFGSGINIQKLVDSFSVESGLFGQTVIHNYLFALFTRTPSVTSPWSYEPEINSSWHKFSFFTIAILLCSISFIILQRLAKKNESINESFILLGIVWIEFILYVIGICIIYISNFNRSEALELASLNRYLSAPYLSICVLVVLLGYEAIALIEKKYIYLLLILGCVYIVAPKGYTLSYLSRQEVTDSQSRRAKYQQLINQIDQYCSTDDRVLFIDQEEWLYPYVTVNYAVRPIKLELINDWPNWYITESIIDHDSFVKEVMQRDYVAIYHRDDYFISEYSNIFSNPDDAESFWLYKVDKCEQKLISVE